MTEEVIAGEEEAKKAKDQESAQVKAEIERAAKGAKLAGLVSPGKSDMKGLSGKKKHRVNRRNTDPRGSKLLIPSTNGAKTLGLVMGREMSTTRVKAVKRVTRRILALMGKDAPSPLVLKWWVAEMISNLDEESGMVRVGVLRVIAEAIGLLRPGLGLMSTSGKASTTWVPRVTFTTKAPISIPQAPHLPLLSEIPAEATQVKVVGGNS